MFIPFGAGAAPMEGRASSTKDREGKDICAELPALRTKATTKLTERVTTMQGKKGDRKTRFEAGRMERAKTLSTKRTERDADRAARYANLRSKATTTAATTAVAAFEKEVERLVAVRKAAIDAKIKAFEEGVLALQLQSDTAVTTLSDKVAADLDAIFDTAEASCAAGKTGLEVRTGIKSGMEAMRANRKNETSATNFKTQFEALRKTRIAATEAALAEFKTGVQKATYDLKAGKG